LQIADAIKRKILSGMWPLGSKVPTVRDLALEMEVNPNTVQRAVTQLEAEGLLHAERTSGRYVSTDPTVIKRARNALTVAEIENFKASMRSIGYKDSEISELFTKQDRSNEGSKTNG